MHVEVKLSKRKCQWCGCAFESAHPSKMFCTKDHQNQFGNFMASRGKVLMPIALSWRTQRGRKGVGSEALAEMVAFLDKCAAELADQGAPPIAQHFKRVRAEGTGIVTGRAVVRVRPSRSKFYG